MVTHRARRPATARTFTSFSANRVFIVSIWKATRSGTRASAPARTAGDRRIRLFYKNLVIVNASIESNSLVALDKKSGKEAWRAKGIGASWNTPVLVEAPGGGTEVILSDDRAVIAFNPSDGKELWRVGGFGGYVCASVVADKGVVYVVRTGARSGGSALAIKAGGRGDVAESHVLWRANGSSLVSSPVYEGGRLYWVDGVVHCLDAATGKEAVKPKRLVGGDRPYASLLLADGKLYAMSIKGGGHVVDASSLEVLSHSKFADDTSRVNASPIVNEGQILLRTDQYLYCIGKK
jgi:outer membrane protein assembly factor BamB